MVQVIEFRSRESAGEVKNTRLCSPLSNEFASEELRGHLYAERLGLLKQALKSGEIVELAFQGPWNPCLNSVRLSSSD